MGDVGAEGREVAEAPRRLPLVERPVGLGGVFDHDQPVLLRDGVDGIHLGRLPDQVHRHDGARPRGDGRLDSGRVDVEGVALDIDEHRGEPGMNDRVAGGYE